MTIREHPLCDCLSDRALPRSGQPVQPVDRRPAEIFRPQLDLIQDGSPGPLQATFTITVLIFGCLRTAEIIEGGRLSCSGFVSEPL